MNTHQFYWWTLFTASFLVSGNAIPGDLLAVQSGTRETHDRPVRIAMLDNILAQSSVVTLGQLAELKGGNKASRKRMEELDFAVGDSQKRVSIDRQELRARLLIAGFRDSQFQISGPGKVMVEKGAVIPLKQRIETAIQSHVANWIDYQPSDIRVELTGPVPQIPPDEHASRRIELLEHGDRIVGRKNVAIGLFDGDEMVRQFRVNAQTSLRKTVLIARRPIERGEPLTNENSFLDDRFIDSANRQTQADESAIGKVTQRRIRSQQVIKTTDLVTNSRKRQENVVRPRDQLLAIASRGGLTVEFSGMEAMKSGKVGDVIPLRNPTSQKIIYGKILDASRVQIRY